MKNKMKFVRKMSMKSIIKTIVFSLLLVSVFWGCETLKESKPIIPIQEYETMLMGRLDANYIGTDNCLSACHFHDKIRRDFEASTMGAQISSESHLPLVNCESCHGPGSLAVEGLTKEKVAQDDAEGYFTQCNYDTLIDLKSLPAQAKSLICLKCHSTNATFNLHNWNAGAHSINDVSCSDCHNPHAGPVLVTEPNEVEDMCVRCHRKQAVEFSLPSHHPVREKRIFCTDCHEPHGTITENLLREDTIKETCIKCHSEKAGPFVFEHADNGDDCIRCHRSHGSVNNNLLIVKEPFLCLQCHATHRLSTADAVSARHTRCTDCHSQIHGTDLPSTSGSGTFLN
jgi:DmsE family decaheme c-type cytochrome